MSGPETTDASPGASAASLLTGAASAFAAFLAFHRFEFLGVGARSAIAFAAATLLAGAAVGFGCARLARGRRRVLPAMLAVSAWGLWAIVPARAGVPAGIGFGVFGAAALAWLLANGCRTRRGTAMAAAGGLLGFAACSAGLAGAVGITAPLVVAVLVAAGGAVAVRLSPRADPPEPPKASSAPVILGAFAWGAVVVSVLRAYGPVARSCPYATADLGVAAAAGIALGIGAFRPRQGAPVGGMLANAGLLVIALLVGYSFFAYPALVMSESAAFQAPAAVLGPGTAFPLWLMAFGAGGAAMMLWPAGGGLRPALALGCAAAGAAAAGLLAGHARAGAALPVLPAALALLWAVAAGLRRAMPGERALSVLVGGLAVCGVAWSLMADPQCGLLGIRRTLALQLSGAEEDGEVAPVRVDAAEGGFTSRGFAASLRRGGMAADFVNGHLVHAGAVGTMPEPSALTVALPLAYARGTASIGVIEPALPATLGCAKALAGEGTVRSWRTGAPDDGGRFDVIVCGPGPLSDTGSPLSVLSEETLRAVRSRLAHGGAFGLWLPVAALEPDVVRSVLATVRGEFPEFHVFLSGYEATIVATGERGVDYATLRRLQPALVGAGLWDPLDLVAGFAADADELSSVLDGVATYSVGRPVRMPSFARRPSRRLWAASVAMLAQHRLAGPQRVVERLTFDSERQKAAALHGFEGIYAEQTNYMLRRLGRLALAGPPEELVAFVNGPLVSGELFADASEGPHARAAAIFLTFGLAESAAAALQQAVDSGQNEPGLHMKLAEVLEALNRPDEALAHYGEVLRLEPDAVPALKRMMALMIATGNNRGAVEVLERFLGQQPDNVPAMLLLAQLYGGPLGQREKAAELARRALAVEPDNADAQEFLILFRPASGAPAPR